MSPEETDKAIDALPDQEFEELCDAATQHWIVRAQNIGLPILVFAAMFALAFLMAAVIKSSWPGSLLAGALASLAWCGIYYSLLRCILSYRVTAWRTRWAIRREYRARAGAA